MKSIIPQVESISLERGLNSSGMNISERSMTRGSVSLSVAWYSFELAEKSEKS
jgi:hypothetical protein